MTPALLANENVPAHSVRLLRDAGYDVAYVAESHAGIGDDAVLDWAVREGRWIVTFDRDYGDLVFARGRATPRCVVFLRLSEYRPEDVAERLLPILGDAESFHGHFVVVESDTVRKRPLPGTR
jgi:predicted nuclease of predicted toxin-antitoxin system